VNSWGGVIAAEKSNISITNYLFQNNIGGMVRYDVALNKMNYSTYFFLILFFV
jgi:hypothetical protein